MLDAQELQSHMTTLPRATTLYTQKRLWLLLK